MNLPKRIQNAINISARPSRIYDSTNVKAGDIRLVELVGEQRNRHVLIVDVNSDPPFCEVMLLHPYEEMITNSDVVLSPDLTGLRYSLVAQTDITGVVWTVDVGRALGHLENFDGSVFSELLVRPDLNGAVGTRLAGPADSRWKFKRDEGLVISELSASCIAGLMVQSEIYDFDSSDLHWMAQLGWDELLRVSANLTELSRSRRLLVSKMAISIDSAGVSKSRKWVETDTDFPRDIVLQLTLANLQRAALSVDDSFGEGCQVMSREQLLEYQ